MKPEIHTVENVLVVGQPGYDRLTALRASRYRSVGYAATVLPADDLIEAGDRRVLRRSIQDFLEELDGCIQSDTTDGVVVVNAREPVPGGGRLPVGTVGYNALLLAYRAGRRRFLSHSLPGNQEALLHLPDPEWIRALDPIPLEGTFDLNEAIRRHDTESA